MKALVPTKRQVEKLMSGNDTYLMVALFQRVFHVHQVENDPTKYVQKYDSEIKDAGRLFEFLELAKRDRTSPLGWKPTHLMMEIIANRVPKQRAKRDSGNDEFIDEFMVELLGDAVFGVERPPQTGILGLEVLVELGLLRENAEGDWEATPRLKLLFADGYHMRLMRKQQRQQSAGQGACIK